MSFVPMANPNTSGLPFVLQALPLLPIATVGNLRLYVTLHFNMMVSPGHR